MTHCKSVSFFESSTPNSKLLDLESCSHRFILKWRQGIRQGVTKCSRGNSTGELGQADFGNSINCYAVFIACEKSRDSIGVDTRSKATYQLEHPW